MTYEINTFYKTSLIFFEVWVPEADILSSVENLWKLWIMSWYSYKKLGYPKTLYIIYQSDDILWSYCNFLVSNTKQVNNFYQVKKNV